jgi:hypothetical protein
MMCGLYNQYYIYIPITNTDLAFTFFFFPFDMPVGKVGRVFKRFTIKSKTSSKYNKNWSIDV